MAAHELLKPLILTEAMTVSVLERTHSRLDLASRRDLESVLHSSARVRLMVEGLLEESRQNGRVLRREHVDMADVVQDCLDLLAPEIKARSARVSVEPMPVVVANAALLNGAMSNLIANAIKYGPRSGGEIRVGAARGGTGWVFEVDSAGKPIPERDRSAIFEPWQRGVGERRARGAGLGLSIVRRVVAIHGGEVGVQPINGRGNRFYFTIPAS